MNVALGSGMAQDEPAVANGQEVPKGDLSTWLSRKHSGSHRGRAAKLNRVGASAFASGHLPGRWLGAGEGNSPGRFRRVFVAAGFDDSQVSNRVPACSALLHATRWTTLNLLRGCSVKGTLCRPR
jgi:hypothetical protein